MNIGSGLSKQLKIISGLSGSGKSVALGALEDLGYYCIDNLPIFLFKQLVENIIHSEDRLLQRVAVSIDSRNREHLDSMTSVLQDFRDMNIRYEIIFLDAEENALVKRFNETRRKHPLMDDDIPLLESIRLETQVLSPLSESATKHIDTTNISPHELRHLIQEDAADPTMGDPTLLIKSFAYKRGTPLDADFVFDVRCLPNPYWVEDLKIFSGLDDAVKTFFSDKPAVESMIDQIDEFLCAWMPKFHAVGRVYLTVAIGCTGGRHRSVYVAERLAERCRDRAVKFQKRHTEISR